jgi:hypothetical protein
VFQYIRIYYQDIWGSGIVINAIFKQIRKIGKCLLENEKSVRDDCIGTHLVAAQIPERFICDHGRASVAKLMEMRVIMCVYRRE